MNEQAARKEYENDVARRPTYHDGTARNTWGQLSDIAKYSWMRPMPDPAPPAPRGLSPFPE